MKRGHFILAIELGLALVYVVSLVGVVEGLPPNVDEGVYAQLAHGVLDGRVPYRDFFFHQTPLYLYQQAAVFGVFGVSLLTMRLPSVIAIAATGVFVSRWTARLSGFWQAGILAEFVWFLAPQQLAVAIGIPNATAVMLVVAGLAVDVSAWPHRRWLTTLLMILGVLAKPTVILFGVALLVPRGHETWCARWRAWIVPVGVGFSMAFGLLLGVSHGAFWSLLVAQVHRFGSHSGYRVLMDNTLLSYLAENLGAVSVFSWNWRTVAQSLGLLSFSVTTASALCCFLGCVVGVGVGRVLGKSWVIRGWQAPTVLLGVVLVSLLWIWDPTWPHYVSMLLIPIVALTGLLGYGIWFRLCGGRPVAQVGVVIFLALTLQAWIGIYVPVPTLYFRQLYASFNSANMAPILSYYPAASLLLGREPACGFVDPLNYVGTIRQLLVDPTDMGNAIDPGASLRHCLATDGSQIWLDKNFLFFTAKDPQWLAWLQSIAPERVYFESDVERHYYETGEHPLIRPRDLAPL